MGNTLDTIFYLVLIVGGLVGVSDYFAAKSEKMKNFVEKIVPAQGIIGIIIAALSVIELITSFADIKYSVLFWLLEFYIVLIALLLGFILSYKLIVKMFIGKKAEIQEKTDKIVGKIQLWQTPLSWINFSNGILMILFMASIEGIVNSILEGKFF